MPAGPASRSWRRYSRFSVRGLLVFVLVIGLGLGWIVRWARIQPEAAAAVRRTGGWVFYDWETRGDHGVVWGEPSAPRWLTDVIGADYFGHITEVRFGVGGTDAAIAHVARLDRVDRMHLDGTTVTDQGLVHLRSMGQRSRLNLNYTQITDAGLSHLKALNELTLLNLRQTNVTDAGLAHLHALTKLSGIDLHGAQVTDVGIEELQRALPGLYIVR